MAINLASDKYMEDLKMQSNPVPANSPAELKKCPFCAEMIQPEAIKCRYCGEFLEGNHWKNSKQSKPKWYFNTRFIILAILCTGPFALPLIWANPRSKISSKVLITLIVIALTAACYYFMKEATRQTLDSLSELGLY